MKKYLLALAVVASSVSVAQEDVLFTIEGEGVTAEEFEYVYNKNKDVGREIDPKTPEEYLDLYINFKLKVHEAQALGMDTVPSFIREFNSYREQLARPYMTVKDVNEQILREAYNNMAWDVRASHIMLDLPENALPEDTLRVYNQLMTVREQILNGQRTFEDAAKSMSTDTYSARQGGDLGWFTAFNMVYPFEKAAYSLDNEEISKPVRTQFGYHLIKNTGRRYSRGKVEVAHILVLVEEDATEAEIEAAERQINEIHDSLMAGSDFAQMARNHSDDRTTASKGGALPAFGMKEMLPDFEEAAFALEEDGDISEPVRTKIGWHILKRIHKYELANFEQVKPELIQKIERDSRSNLGQQVFLNQLRSEYDFTLYERPLMEILNSFEEGFEGGTWTAESFEDSDDAVYSWADREITQAEIAKHIESIQERIRGNDLKSAAYGMAQAYAKNKLLEYEREQLPVKYPEFRFLVQEYREGILLFDLTKEKVWDKASQDTSGLKAYYEEHRSDYVVGPRYKYVRVSSESRSVADQVLSDLQDDDVTGARLIEKYNQESQLAVRVDTLTILVGEDEQIDQAAEGSLFTYQKDNRWITNYVIETIPEGPRPLKEIRGLVTSDYQKVLESNWIEELRAKYEVEVNEDLMEELEAEL